MNQLCEGVVFRQLSEQVDAAAARPSATPAVDRRHFTGSRRDQGTCDLKFKGRHVTGNVCVTSILLNLTKNIYGPDVLLLFLKAASIVAQQTGPGAALERLLISMASSETSSELKEGGNYWRRHAGWTNDRKRRLNVASSFGIRLDESPAPTPHHATAIAIKLSAR